RLNHINKIHLIGAQEEKIYIEGSDKQLAALGIDPLLIISTLQEQNVLEPAGAVVTDRQRVPPRVEGAFDSLERIRAIGIRAGDRLFRLGDVAEIFRVLGPDPARLRPIVAELTEILRAHPHTRDVNDDWRERIPVLRLRGW
ncbi:hypothetical protein RZS08_23335, partial [Arthrospira platensis SPKY1]|nr:hypothetical protein [Arthrospira platensis SPKY1]